MRMLTCLVVLACLTGVALAGANPYVSVYVTFDPSVWEYQPRVDPEPYTWGEVFVCLMYVDGGITEISFAVDIDAGVSGPPSWSCLLPGGTEIGTWRDGITLRTSECVTGDMCCVGRGELFYLGAPGLIRIVDHPDYARWVVDCNGEVDYYCHINNAGVLMDPPPTGEDCAPPYNPAEPVAWGRVKALYR